jgi:hypothetical protein
VGCWGAQRGPDISRARPAERAAIAQARKGDAGVARFLAKFVRGALLPPVPDFLADYVVETLSKGWPENRRGHPRGSIPRARLIEGAVDRVCQAFDVPRTRNAATEAPSGCSIVAEALASLGLHLSEARVAEIATYSRRFYLDDPF